MTFYSFPNDEIMFEEDKKRKYGVTKQLRYDFNCYFLLYCCLTAPLMPNGLPQNRATLQTQREITIANDLIGCIIGRGGQKISEIRWD